MGLHKDVAAVLRGHRVGMIDECDQIAHAVMVPVSAHVDTMAAVIEQQRQEIEKLRLYLSHAVKFSFGTDMASHAEVTRAEQNRPDGDWFFRSWGPTERHATQEAALEAALERARENGGPQ